MLVDKPSGPTSHDVIDELRRITGQRTIGHAGTLDPFASGLLLVAVGRAATKTISRFVKLDKEYEAELRLGAVTDTYDRTGKIRTVTADADYDLGRIKEALGNFTGELDQLPPIYSAKKVNGQKLYELARRGLEIERPLSRIRIYEIKLLDYAWPRLVIQVRCSSGTYIRALAHDIGARLSCGAYLEELRRTAIGEFRIGQAIPLNKLTRDNWQEHLFDL